MDHLFLLYFLPAFLPNVSPLFSKKTILKAVKGDQATRQLRNLSLNRQKDEKIHRKGNTKKLHVPTFDTFWYCFDHDFANFWNILLIFEYFRDFWETFFLTYKCSHFVYTWPVVYHNFSHFSKMRKQGG